MLPPYGEREGCSARKGGQERGLCRERRRELCRWEGGRKLEGADVASETVEAKLHRIITCRAACLITSGSPHVTVQEQEGKLNSDLLWSPQILMKRC